MNDVTHSVPDPVRSPDRPAVYRAEDLLAGESQVHIALGERTYTLRLTRAGKLILTR